MAPRPPNSNRSVSHAAQLVDAHNPYGKVRPLERAMGRPNKWVSRLFEKRQVIPAPDRIEELADAIHVSPYVLAVAFLADVGLKGDVVSPASLELLERLAKIPEPTERDRWSRFFIAYLDAPPGVPGASS